MAIRTEVVPVEENRVRIDVVVPKEEVDKKIDRTLKRLGREVRIPGFRPGKAPAKVVAQRFGQEIVFEEMLREALGEWYGQAIAETGVDDISIGDLTKDLVSVDLSMRFLKP